MSSIQRRLTVIVVADVAKFSDHMKSDQDQALTRLREFKDTFETLANENGGRLFNVAGDAFLGEFSSGLAAVTFAYDFQDRVRASNDKFTDRDNFLFRVGINIGDVIAEGDDLYGDGVNVAARLEAFSMPGGVSVTKALRDLIDANSRFSFEDQGEHQVKNTRFHAFDLNISSAPQRADKETTARQLTNEKSLSEKPDKYNSIVKIRGLVKSYGKFTAIDNLDLDIAEGEILALLGPNGAGKTTLISTICGATAITNGNIVVDDFDVEKNYKKARELIGLVPQELVGEPFETVESSLRFAAKLYGKSHDEANIRNLLKKLALWEKRESKFNDLSGGMKKRLLIGKALVHGPRILFLDEPTAGVDVELRRDLWKLIFDLKNDGVTIVLTTHYMEEAETVSDKIAIINAGKLVLQDETKRLKGKLGRKRLIFSLGEHMQSIPKDLSELGVKVSASQSSLEFDMRDPFGDEALSLIISKFHENGISINNISVSERSLEDIFVDLVKENDK